MKNNKHNMQEHNQSNKDKTVELPIEGMTCKNCENTIKTAIEKVSGVKAANADYVLEKAVITYDPNKTSEKRIISAIDKAGYSVIGKSKGKRDGKNEEESDGPDSYFEFSDKAFYITIALGIAVLMFGAYLLLKNFGINFEFPELSKNASYAILFGIGLLTGFHCIAMCGGFVLSYTIKDESGKSKNNIINHAKYGISKTISYTIIGAIFGLIGSAIAFTPKMRGIAAIIAGLFLIMFGLNMLGYLKPLRKIRIPQPKFISKIKAKNNPVMIGLLNGLFIACGPLQAMYIFAAGTGDVIQGALSLMFFGLGTLPAMLGFGMAASYLSKSFTHNILKFSGILVLVLGLIMMNRGLSLSGSGYDFNTLKTTIIEASNAAGNNQGQAANPDSIQNPPGYKPSIDASTQIAEQKDGYQTILMDVTNQGWTPDKFVLKKGVPTRWIINGKEINGCNNAIVVPKYNLNFKIKQGEQTIEFTPTESGVIPWSCWMGMIPGTFIVKDELPTQNDAAAIQQVQQEADAVPVKKSGSCGMGGTGGCGCGRRAA